MTFSQPYRVFPFVSLKYNQSDFPVLCTSKRERWKKVFPKKYFFVYLYNTGYFPNTYYCTANKIKFSEHTIHVSMWRTEKLWIKHNLYWEKFQYFSKGKFKPPSNPQLHNFITINSQFSPLFFHFFPILFFKKRNFLLSHNRTISTLCVPSILLEMRVKLPIHSIEKYIFIKMGKNFFFLCWMSFWKKENLKIYFSLHSVPKRED